MVGNFSFLKLLKNSFVILFSYFITINFQVSYSCEKLENSLYSDMEAICGTNLKHHDQILMLAHCVEKANLTLSNLLLAIFK